MTEAVQPPAKRARDLVRASSFAHLSTLDAADGWPYGSLIMTACDHDGSPLIMISQLAVHTKNIAADSRVALLFDHTSGYVEKLANARATVMGRAEATEAAGPRDRFCARHPNAVDLLELDFSIFKVHIERGHFVGGFGDVHGIDGDDLKFNSTACADLIAHEADIIEHMNADHADAIDLYANVLLGQDGTGWQMTGCDPEGCDLYQNETIGRLSFPNIAHNPDEARTALVGLANLARSQNLNTS